MPDTTSDPDQTTDQGSEQGPGEQSSQQLAGEPAEQPPGQSSDERQPAPSGQPSGERIAVGRINSTWGLKGHVRVTPFTSNDARFVTGARLIVAGQPRVALEVISPQGYPMIRFVGFESRTAAEALRGAVIEIEADELPALPEGDYYVDDLRGLTVVTTDGTEVGTLADVLTTGANDVYLVRRPGQKDALIPAIKDVVLSVDLAAKQMVIDPLPGLLDL
ncbi:MAG: ribosome maturation factor RimM [Chloroflexi bacterium]|nr:ribosome maturation factor RimM [Chloroflexota bacterium]MDA1147751.1 ribosome maturation factor RimM [Chloroflexota bacterium]